MHSLGSFRNNLQKARGKRGDATGTRPRSHSPWRGANSSLWVLLGVKFADRRECAAQLRRMRRANHGRYSRARHGVTLAAIEDARLPPTNGSADYGQGSSQMVDRVDGSSLPHTILSLVLGAEDVPNALGQRSSQRCKAAKRLAG